MNGMKNRLFAIGAMILMMTSCTQDELISSDNGKEPATAGSCLTLVGLSSPQTRVSIGDKTGDVYPVIWSEGDALGVFSRTAGTDINNVQSLLSDESIGRRENGGRRSYGTSYLLSLPGKYGTGRKWQQDYFYPVC